MLFDKLINTNVVHNKNEFCGFCDFVTEKIFQVGYTVIENKFREVKYDSINHYKK